MGRCCEPRVQHEGLDDALVPKDFETSDPGNKLPSNAKISANRRRKCTDWPICSQILYSTLCLIVPYPLYWCQHNWIMSITITVVAYGWEVLHETVKDESVWQTMLDLKQMDHPSNWAKGVHCPWALYYLVFLWSYCYPWVKYSLCLLVFVFQGLCTKTDRGFRNLGIFLSVIHWLGKWSYADLFVSMNLGATIQGDSLGVRPTSMFDVSMSCGSILYPNTALFVVLIANSMILIWYFRWSRQDPELALGSKRRISLFTFTWERGEWKMALLNSGLLVVLTFFWVLSMKVDFAYRWMYYPLWELDDTQSWNFWTLQQPFETASGLLILYFITVIALPSFCVLFCFCVWFIPMGAYAHSWLRLFYSWVQMFSCPDVFLACLIASLSADHDMFVEIVQSAIRPYGQTMIESGFGLQGKVIWETIYIPITACALLLWFRHYMGQQIRRRLEARPDVLEKHWKMEETLFGRHKVRSGVAGYETVSASSILPTDSEAGVPTKNDIRLDPES